VRTASPFLGWPFCLRTAWELIGVGAFVGFLEQHAGFVDGALGVVVGLDGEAVLIDGAIALAGDVEDAADGDVAPDLVQAGSSSPRRASRNEFTLAW